MRRKTLLQKRATAKVHPDLHGLKITINPLGRVEFSCNMEEINSFLNNKVHDKKLESRS